jgi:hypothetical protein
MTFESSVDQFKQAQSLLFTAVIETKNCNLKIFVLFGSIVEVDQCDQ